jgi:hypothetical protein
MPSLSLLTSALYHHVLHTLLTPLITLDTLLDHLVHRTRQERDAQTRPGRAHARQSAHGERRRRVWPRRRPSASVDPSLSSLRQTLHDTTLRRPDIAIGPRERRSQRPSRRRPPRVLAAPVMRTSSFLPRFQRRQALRHHQRLTNPAASSPVAELLCSFVINDELIAAPRPPPVAIKRDPPASNSSHRQPPLPLLPRLAHFPCSISRRRRPIATSKPRRC